MTDQPRSTTDGLLLVGLDGSNPLGFLAALGVLRMLDSSWCMRWVPTGGTWVPSVTHADQGRLEQEQFLNDLLGRLVSDISEHPVSVLQDLGDGKANERRRLFVSRGHQATLSERSSADWLSAFACDFASPEAINQLQTARRDYFFKNLTEVIRLTTVEHLRRTLFSLWDYADPLHKQSLHLDPSEDRRHAHQWNQPSGDPNRRKSGSMLGANRLAIEAICLFASVPKGDALQTIGFSGTRSTDTRWTWPIWDVNCSLLVVRSLLTLPALQEEQIRESTRTALRQSGVKAAFRTNRILVGKTPNFTPPRRVA